MKVLDGAGDEIELKDDEDDDFTPTFGAVENSRSDDREFERSGYNIEQIDEDQLDLDFGGDSDGYTDDDYTEDGEEDIDL